MVNCVAFVEDQVNFDVAPDARNAGDAVIVTVGTDAASALLDEARAIAMRNQGKGRSKRSNARTFVILRFTMTASRSRHPAVWYRKSNPRFGGDCPTIGQCRDGALRHVRPAFSRDSEITRSISSMNLAEFVMNRGASQPLFMELTRGLTRLSRCEIRIF